jgi:AcrR family transcriptional regulator
MTERSVNKMSPRNKIQNEAVRRASIDRIMNACLELFSRQGFAATSVNQIAKRAGVSKGLLYNYFESKDEMLQELVAYFSREAEELIGDIHAEEPRVFLKNLIQISFSQVRERTDIWRMVTAMSMQPDMHTFIHDIALEKRAEYLPLLEELLRKTGWEDPANEAQVLAATLDGVAMHYLVSGTDYPMKATEDYMIKKYCS